MSLRVKGRAGLWTFSDVCEHIQHDNFFGDRSPFSCLPVLRSRVAREIHSTTGKPHFHALVEYRSSVDIKRRAETFDLVCGTCGLRRHPNLNPKRPGKALRNARTYLTKEGNYVDFGEPFPESDTEPEETTAGSRLKAALEAAEGDFGKFVEGCLDRKLNSSLLKAYWDHHNAEWRSRTLFDATSRSDATVSSLALSALQYDPEEPRSYVLIGESGVGKTTWAIRNAPKPALWVRHSDALRHWKDSVHKSIIFDDVTFLHTPHENQINMCDTRAICEPYTRYKNVAIPPGVPRIFTCNPWAKSLDWDNNPAIKRRCFIVEC